MTTAGTRTRLDRPQAAACGMLVALHAREHPERSAIVSPNGDRSFHELNARANQLARALRRRGLAAGDSVALVCANRPEFAEVMAATLRAGLRVTPINWHLTGAEMGYIVENCRARALVGDVRFADAVARAAEAAAGPEPGVRLAVGGPIEGFEAYGDALKEEDDADLDDPVLGTSMLYTSGTTGHPKGVYRPPVKSGRVGRAVREAGRASNYQPGRDVHLCTGPLYHAAPLAFSLAGPLNLGVGVVLMDGWDAAETLALVERHRVTHTHMVPTMFHRLLALPRELREGTDTSSLRFVLHGAAPCPVAVKQAMMDWLGPVLYEYYAATEGFGSFVTPEVWLAKPGTVGRPDPGQVVVRDEDGSEVGPGVVGTLYLRTPEEGPFQYFGDDGKTARAYDPSGGHFTLGDMGRLDEDGFLYLCDRSADVIISGGVNVYPAEVDAVLLEHPAVGDVATIGVPDDEWGERVLAVVEPRAGIATSPALADELVAFCRERLAHYKCPREVDFVPQLPRSDAGKIVRRRVREPYWAGREKRI